MLTHSTKTVVRELLAREIRELEKHLAPYKIDEVESYSKSSPETEEGRASFKSLNTLRTEIKWTEKRLQKLRAAQTEIKRGNLCSYTFETDQDTEGTQKFFNSWRVAIGALPLSSAKDLLREESNPNIETEKTYLGRAGGGGGSSD